MATTDKTLITTAGRSMLVDLDNNKAHANGFNIYFSTGDLTGMTDDQLVNLQDIQSKDIKVKAEVIKLDQGDTKIRAQAIYTGNQNGIYIKTYATYAVDDQGNELLFALYLNSEPQYLLASNDDQETTQGYGFNVGISQTDNVNFTKLSNITATLQDVQQMIDGGNIVSLESNQNISGNKNFLGDLQYQGNEVATTIVGQLTDSDDILNLTKDGHYTINGANPANNPWGNKKIWADVYKTDYQTVIRDNLGTEYIRSYYDSTWKETLNNLDLDSMNKDVQTLSDEAYQYRGYYNGAFANLAKIKRGTYALAQYSDGMPNGFSGYGNLVLSGNDTDTYYTLNDNLGGMWTKVNDKIWHAVSTNDDANIIFKNRGYWTDNLMNLTYQPAGTYGIANNMNNAPTGFSGYGVANVYKNATDSWVDLIDNTNGRWTIHIGSTWQKMVNSIDYNALQTQINAIDSAYTYQGVITNSTDLNTVTQPGIYYCTYAVPTNSPTQFAGAFPRFKLQVSSFGSGIINQSIYVFDGYGTQGIPSFYNRNTYTGGNFNAWTHAN